MIKYIVSFITLMIFLHTSAQASQWQILPGVSVPLLYKNGAQVVGTEVTRLDPGLMVVTTYLVTLTERRIFRCAEYVTEFQFELTRSACFEGLVPEPVEE